MPESYRRRSSPLRLIASKTPREADLEAQVAREGLEPSELGRFGAYIARGELLLKTDHQLRLAELALTHALQARRCASLEVTVETLAGRVESLEAAETRRQAIIAELEGKCPEADQVDQFRATLARTRAASNLYPRGLKAVANPANTQPQGEPA